MAGSVFSEKNHVVMLTVPVANFAAGTVTSDEINIENYHHITFYRYQGTGTTGTSTITVEACSNTSGSNNTAIVFKYREMTTNDTWGAVTAATTAGFTTTAGSDGMWAIEVDAQEAAYLGYNYVRLVMTEVAASAVVGCTFAILSEPRYAEDIQGTVLT